MIAVGNLLVWKHKEPNILWLVTKINAIYKKGEYRSSPDYDFGFVSSDGNSGSALYSTKSMKSWIRRKKLQIMPCFPTKEI